MARAYQVTDADRYAIFKTAKNLGMDPYSLGAILEQESGTNPNIWGGDGGNYYGAIQFGGPERKEAGLDPNKIGKYTLAEQMPHVEKWMRGRGFKPGMGPQKAYATILGGNPNANIDLPDSNQTTVRNSTAKFLPGGSLYQVAQKKLGDAQGVGAAQPTTVETGGTTNNQYGGINPQELLKSTIQSFYGVGDNQGSGGDIIFNVLNTVAEKQKPKESILKSVLDKFVAQYMPDFGQGDNKIQTAKKKGSLLDEYIQSSIRSGYVDPTQLLGPLGLG